MKEPNREGWVVGLSIALLFLLMFVVATPLE